jgi:hypothetical protein
MNRHITDEPSIAVKADNREAAASGTHRRRNRLWLAWMIVTSEFRAMRWPFLTTKGRTTPRFTPANCPYCEYDRCFPETSMGGWLRFGNYGPYVSCPLCNNDGAHPMCGPAGAEHDA